MLHCIMLFLNRSSELDALDRIHKNAPALGVVWGRRRIGKTRLLLESCRRTGGVYIVADQSDAAVQRDFTARAIAQVLPGFGDVTYPDWERLLSRLATDARALGFRGPVIIDELPYLVAASPELPSVLQRWVDHEAKRAGITLVIAGSSQRMMQGLVLDAAAPLYGRAQLLLDLRPLAPRYLPGAMGRLAPVDLVKHWAAWGGVPRYWELAAQTSGSVEERVVALALDPAGPLFTEPERLLLEETPPALEIRPLLDAIGGGAHRVSEIAGRLGRPATSLARPLDRLLSLGFVRRETPYGEPLRGGKRSLYKLDDPFLRLWFRVVAPNRGALIAGTRLSRTATLASHWPGLLGQAWEEMCRQAIGSLRAGSSRIASLGPWRPAHRHWHGNDPEWDLVADAVSGKTTLVGEAWFRDRPVRASEIREAGRALLARPLPPGLERSEVVRALFVPAVVGRRPAVAGLEVVTLNDLLQTEG